MRVVTKKISSWRGVNNVTRPQATSEDELQVALNVDIDDAGGMALRPGGELLLSSSEPHSIMTDGTDLLYRQGTNLLRLDPVARTTEVVQTGFTSGLVMAWEHLNDALYCTDGEQSGIYQDSAWRSWGFTVPPTPTLTTTTGSLLAGEYQVALTYLRRDGQESGASTEKRILVADNGAIQASVTASSDSSCTGIVVYCSTANGKTLYKQWIVPNRTGTTTIKNRVRVGKGRQCDTLHLSAPPSGDLIAFYRGRIYIANGPWLYYTEPWRYELFSWERNIARFSGDITMLAALENGIWVGTTRGTQFLYGLDPQQDGGFQIRGRLKTYPPLRSAVVADGQTLRPSLRLAPGKVALWPTDEGIMAGDNEGQARNITDGQWVAPSGDVGTGFISDTLGGAQYIFGIQGTPGQGSGDVRVTINQ